MADAVEVESRLTSLNFLTLQHICIILDLKQYLKMNISSSPSHISNYIILPFPILYQSNKQIMIANQFIKEYNDQLPSIQVTHKIDVQFVTSNTSETLLNDVIQCQYDLVTKSSNYSEAKQIVNSLWIILSTTNSMHINMMKTILYERWNNFLKKIEYHSKCNVQNEKASYQLVTISTWYKLKRSENKHKKTLTKQQTKLTRKITAHSRIVPIFQTNSSLTADSDNEYDMDDDGGLIRHALTCSQARLQFLSNRFDNSSKYRLPRTHRRQHMLALVLIA